MLCLLFLPEHVARCAPALTVAAAVAASATCSASHELAGHLSNVWVLHQLLDLRHVWHSTAGTTLSHPLCHTPQHRVLHQLLEASIRHHVLSHLSHHWVVLG